MQIFVKSSLLRHIKVLVSTFLLLILIFSSPSVALATNRGQSTEEWFVSISGLDGLVCLGDEYMLTAKWMPNAEDKDLGYLSGAAEISVRAKLGSLDHTYEHPGTASGTAYFIYTAGKAGKETVTIKLFDSNNDLGGENTASFEVKQCNYMYTLFARSDFSIPDPSFTWYSILKSKGRLVAPDPSRPTYREAFNKTITEENFVTSFPNSDCEVDWINPGYALGFVDSKLVEADDGRGLKLMIGPPIDFEWTYQLIIVCPENAVNANGAFPLTTSGKDPWIEQVFPFGEGKVNIKIDMLDQHLKDAAKVGITGSYTATISLEREEAK